MKKAIGMVEYKTVSSGMRAADRMVKTAEVELLQADTVCPGKFLVLISGDLSAVKASVDAAAINDSEQLIDSFVLGNPHESIFSALYGATEIKIVAFFKASGVNLDSSRELGFCDVISINISRSTTCKGSFSAVFK